MMKAIEGVMRVKKGNVLLLSRRDRILKLRSGLGNIDCITSIGIKGGLVMQITR